MYPTKATFKNELSNEITIQIRNVMGDQEGLEDSIQIDIEGPGSQVEQTLTPVEAYVLMRLLEQHFGFKPFVKEDLEVKIVDIG